MDSMAAKEIILKNLIESGDGLTGRMMIYEAHIKELAYVIASDACEDAADDFELISNRVRDAYFEFLSQFDERLYDKVLSVKFCSYIGKELALKGVLPDTPEELDFAITDGDISVACLPSRTTNEAYSVFSRRIRGVSQIMSDSVAEACESVSEGRCTFCMLPVYSSSDGLMQSVYRHTLRYGLSWVMSFDLRSDGDFSVRYALFASSLLRLKGADTMTVTVVADANEVAWLPEAFSEYGASLVDINTIPPAMYDGNKAWQFTFSLENADLITLELFLRIHFPRFEINGIYEEIKG